MANNDDKKETMIEGMYQLESGYGIGGINGMHHNELGWDNTTVGMASSVFDNVLTQNGVRTYDLIILVLLSLFVLVDLS